MGASASSMMGYGVFFWLPSFFSRSFQLGLVETGWLFGGVLFVAGSLGIFLGGVMGDVMGKAKRSAFATVPAIAFLLSAPLYWAGIMAPSPMMAVIILFIPTALGLAWLGPVLSAFQHLMPPHMRTSASSVFLLINNLLGIGGGVYVLGRVSTVLQPTFAADLDRDRRQPLSRRGLLHVLGLALPRQGLGRRWRGRACPASRTADGG
jgi:MFS family permease